GDRVGVSGPGGRWGAGQGSVTGRGQGAVTGRGRGIVARRAAPFPRYRPAADVMGGMGRRVGAGRARGGRAGSRDARRRRTVRNGPVDPPAPPGGGGVCSPMFGTPNSEHTARGKHDGGEPKKERASSGRGCGGGAA